MKPQVIFIRPAPPFYEGFRLCPRTDVVIEFEGRFYGSRFNRQIDDNEATRSLEAAAFILRRKYQ